MIIIKIIVIVKDKSIRCKKNNNIIGMKVFLIIITYNNMRTILFKKIYQCYKQKVNNKDNHKINKINNNKVNSCYISRAINIL